MAVAAVAVIGADPARTARRPTDALRDEDLIREIAAALTGDIAC
ncbi:hypothetical protein [Rhodopseudomonas sp. WA056]|nr:hypothetical protein [Rhodopseudomonas sp. WA056]